MFSNLVILISNLATSIPPPWANPWAYIVPQALEKIFQMPDPAGNFCWQMLHPHSFCGVQMTGPPVHPIKLQNY